MSERANIAAKRLGKKSASTLHDPKAAAAQAIVHLDDDLHGELLSQYKKQQKEDDKARRAAEHGIRRFVSGKSRLAKALPAWATM